MNTLFIGKNFIQLPVVDSTNAFLAALQGSGPAEGTVVSAASQTSGRGQQGSTWHGAPGLNLAFSVLLHPHFLSAAQVFSLSKAAALATADALRPFLPGHNILVKWPNDVLLDGRKVAGILIENQLGSTRVQSSIIGIGINVNQTAWDPGYGTPTSLAAASGRSHDTQEVLHRVLEQLERRYMALRANRHEAIDHDYLHALHGYQEEVPVIIDGQATRAIPVGVDPHGRLAVQVDGRLRYFGIKEIQFIL